MDLEYLELKVLDRVFIKEDLPLSAAEIYESKNHFIKRGTLGTIRRINQTSLTALVQFGSNSLIVEVKLQILEKATQDKIANYEKENKDFNYNQVLPEKFNIDSIFKFKDDPDMNWIILSITLNVNEADDIITLISENGITNTCTKRILEYDAEYTGIYEYNNSKLISKEVSEVISDMKKINSEVSISSEIEENNDDIIIIVDGFEFIIKDNMMIGLKNNYIEIKQLEKYNQAVLKILKLLNRRN